MRRFGKYLTIFMTMLGVLLLLQAQEVEAASSTRLWGNDRYLTAIEVSREGWSAGADTVIITNGENYPDALSAAPLAKKYNAPILLTPSDRLDTNTGIELKRLKTKKAVLVGGEGVISPGVVKQLNLMGITTMRLAGQDRYDTALAVALDIGLGNGVFVLKGETFQDALVAAPIAAAKGMPILLVPDDDLTADQKAALAKVKLTRSVIVGNQADFGTEVLEKFPAQEWITGSDAYDRNVSLVDHFADDLDLDKAYVATGRDFPDALAAAALAQKGRNPVFILNGNRIPTQIRSYITDHVISNFVVLGGTGVINYDTEDDLSDLSAHYTSYRSISVRILEKQSYELPKTVTMRKSNGEWEEVPVSWGLSSISTLKAGTYYYEGTVKGYGGTVSLTLRVDPIPTKAAALTAEIVLGDSYYLPDTVPVTLSDNTVEEYPVTWSTKIVTLNKTGSYSFQGTVEGTTLKVTLSLKVSEDSMITFTDPGLESVVREALNEDDYTRPIYKRDILKITYLDGAGSNISDISSLSAFTNLQHLELQSNNLDESKLSPLQKLTNLTYLNLEANLIKQVSALKGLTNLTYLNVSDNQITDFSPLKGLIRLSTLYISGNATQDYSSLRSIYNNLSREDFDL